MGYQESVDGGTGRDTLTFDKSDQYFQAFYIETAQGWGGYTASSSFEQLRQGLEGAVSFRIYTTTAGGGGCNLSYRNIEAVNWTAGAGNDLLVYQGGTHYDGGAGTDAFYADFSDTMQAVNWDADTNSFTWWTASPSPISSACYSPARGTTSFGQCKAGSRTMSRPAGQGHGGTRRGQRLRGGRRRQRHHRTWRR